MSPRRVYPDLAFNGLAPMGEYANYRRASAALHRLWTMNVGQPGYDKELWKALDQAIYLLATDGPGEYVGPSPPHLRPPGDPSKPGGDR